MAEFKGIDVSEWQKVIDWNKVKEEIDFAVIRLGYGKGNQDKYAERNITEMNRLGIPYGVYWFSYAYTEDMAKNEAKKTIAILKKLAAKLSYPVYFDWEYDSRNYAEKNGVKVGKDLLCKMATAFCEEIEAAGMYAGIYANPDYIKNHFGGEIFKRYDLWVAHYSKTTDYKANMWQYTPNGKVTGISGNVDMNRCVVDYPKIISGTGKDTTTNKTPKKTVKEVAQDVIAGKYGNGEDRKKKLKAEGYDPAAVQAEVNRILTGKKTVTEIAKEVIAGKWGVGQKRKKRLRLAGYDYKEVQAEVNRLLK